MKTQKIKVRMILFIIFIVIIFIYYMRTNTDRKNIAFLKSYGWEVDHNGTENFLDRHDFITQTLNHVRELSDFDNLTSKLSEIGIGFDEDTIETVTIYSYILKQVGNTEPMKSYVWVSKGDIIFAYVTHLETHTLVNYWPVNYDYEQIKKELEDLKVDYSK